LTRRSHKIRGPGDQTDAASEISTHAAVCAPFSIASVTAKVESDESFVAAARQFIDFRMPERVYRVAVPGPPMLFHRTARKLVVLGIAFVALCPIDQLHNVGSMPVRRRAQEFRFGLLSCFLRQLLKQGGDHAS
jgi:hypothetical protein